MSFYYQERTSSHPYVQAVWHGVVKDSADYWVPADGCWDLIIAKSPTETRVFLAGPMTQARRVRFDTAVEFTGIRFKTGAYIPDFPPVGMVNKEISLNASASSAGWFQANHLPELTCDNAEELVTRMCEQGMLASDPVVAAILREEASGLSVRTVQRHFAKTVGLSRAFIDQVERVGKTAELLRAGWSAASAAYQLNYADQAHLTRVCKLLLGRTPTEYAKTSR